MRDWGNDVWQVFALLNAVLVSVTSKRLRKVYIRNNKYNSTFEEIKESKSTKMIVDFINYNWKKNDKY